MDFAWDYVLIFGVWGVLTVAIVAALEYLERKDKDDE